MSLTIYGQGLSQPTRSVLLFFDAANIAYSFEEINFFNGEQRTPNSLAMNPSGLVPFISDNGDSLAESAAILQYLAKSRMKSEWYPTEPTLRAKNVFVTLASF